jgi:hypothetical protein
VIQNKNERCRIPNRKHPTLATLVPQEALPDQPVFYMSPTAEAVFDKILFNRTLLGPGFDSTPLNRFCP